MYSRKGKVIVAASVALALVAVGCRENKGALLVGKWRSVKIVNRDKDEFFKNSRIFIDTMGKNNSDSVNLEIYGVTNVDSLRKELKIQFDSAYAAAVAIDTQSVLTFNNDSTITFSFPGKTEKGKWYIDKNNQLVLDETNEYGETEQMKVNVTAIEGDNMTLTFMRDGENGSKDTSIVTFRREK